jgi:hypothetical protein
VAPSEARGAARLTDPDGLEATHARAYLPLVAEVRAELVGARGDEAGEHRGLREAHRLYDEMGATGHADRLAKVLAS